MRQKLVVCFDVDGCLIYQVGDKIDTPRYDVISLFHAFEELGCEMRIHSGGGTDYAEYWRNKLGLNAEVWPKVLMKDEDKPDICFDDLEVTLAKVNVRV